MQTPEQNQFWKDKHVLLTGHTGFKGSWLALKLLKLGARITGLALPPTTTPNLYEEARVSDGICSHMCDIRDARATSKIINDAEPEIIFHLAAQPLVRESYLDPLETFTTNVMGTTHVLDALRDMDSVKVAIIITSDKVYRNNEWLWPYREEDTLGGHDPYSASKAASEIIIASYRDAFLKDQGVAIASARAGNVIGGGDWSKDRIIPDAIRAWHLDQTLNIRYPDAIRPWQHVLDPLNGYINLAEKLWNNPDLAQAYNFGPHTQDAVSVRKLIQLARQYYGKGEIYYGDSTNQLHEAGSLALEISKSNKLLNVAPKWDLQKTVRRTMEWYSNLLSGINARTLCERDIDEYDKT